MTRTLGEAWAENGIRVNGIAPGLVDTKMTKATTANPKRLEGALERIPSERLGTPADMAGAALFLASPLASYVIGQTIVVDGGLDSEPRNQQASRRLHLLKQGVTAMDKEQDCRLGEGFCRQGRRRRR